MSSRRLENDHLNTSCAWGDNSGGHEDEDVLTGRIIHDVSKDDRRCMHVTYDARRRFAEPDLESPIAERPTGLGESCDG